VRVTGITRIMSKMETYLLQSQVNGFALAFVAVALLLFALLRSVKLTALVMLPNVVPVVIGLGAMAALGIPLDPGTAMIASLALGIVDDDTVHFVVVMREYLRAGVPMPTAVTRTIPRVGRPTLAMSAILALGFAALLTGSFKPNVNFAAVTLIVIVLAVLGDLLLMPAVLTLASRAPER
jgi:predicted RND superfamily exporter protein